MKVIYKAPGCAPEPRGAAVGFGSGRDCGQWISLDAAFSTSSVSPSGCHLPRQRGRHGRLRLLMGGLG